MLPVGFRGFLLLTAPGARDFFGDPVPRHEDFGEGGQSASWRRGDFAPANGFRCQLCALGGDKAKCFVREWAHDGENHVPVFFDFAVPISLNPVRVCYVRIIRSNPGP